MWGKEKTKTIWKELWQQRTTDTAIEDDRRSNGETWYLSDWRKKRLVTERSGEEGSMRLTPPLGGINSRMKDIFGRLYSFGIKREYLFNQNIVPSWSFRNYMKSGLSSRRMQRDGQRLRRRRGLLKIWTICLTWNMNAFNLIKIKEDQDCFVVQRETGLYGTSWHDTVASKNWEQRTLGCSFNVLKFRVTFGFWSSNLKATRHPWILLASRKLWKRCCSDWRIKLHIP